MTLTLTAADLKLLNAGFPISIQAPTPQPIPPVLTGPAVQVLAGKLVDGAGRPLRLKGVNISGLESVAIQGWSPKDPWGGQTPNWAAIKAWGCNAVRIPFNTASWLGNICYDYSGTARDPDPGKNYRAFYKAKVDAATAAGLYVILDQHWSAPLMLIGAHQDKLPFSPMVQGPAPDPDTSLPMWTQVATMFKGYPNVMFDLFNEWHADSWGGTPGQDSWKAWLSGGSLWKFPNQTSGGANFDFVQTTATTGMQQMLDAVRKTGAANVCLAGGICWAGESGGWLTHTPVDPLKQLACSVHLYPTYGAMFGTPAYNAMPTARFAQLQAIQAAGFPVIVGETGGHCAPGTKGEPFTQGILDWCALRNASVLAWTWNVWQNSDHVLIKDAAGTPTDGYGQIVHAAMVLP